jgi:hypothetical protein
VVWTGKTRPPHKLLSRSRAKVLFGIVEKDEVLPSGRIIYSGTGEGPLTVGVDLLKHHGDFANNASHQVQEWAAVIVHPACRTRFFPVIARWFPAIFSDRSWRCRFASFSGLASTAFGLTMGPLIGLLSWIVCGGFFSFDTSADGSPRPWIGSQFGDQKALAEPGDKLERCFNN